MKHKIDVFINIDGWDNLSVVQSLQGIPQIERVYAMSSSEKNCPVGVSLCRVDDFSSSKTLRLIARESTADYIALFLKPFGFKPAYRCFERLFNVIEDSGATMVYSDRWEQRMGKQDQWENPVAHPTIDYQVGSVRDDFDFGGLWLVRGDLLRRFVVESKQRYRFAAPYALRLFLSREGSLVHLREFLYAENETDLRHSGEKQFDYVHPSAREVQIEMERACTHHLKAIGAWLAPDEFDEVEGYTSSDGGYEESSTTENFPVTASVIIPVRNRVRTIADAVKSALSQETTFPFNVIVIDNHSTDGTRETVEQLVSDLRVVLLCPERTDLSIGGCWDFAIRTKYCGRYAVQLDSDDLYSDTHTLAKIVAAFVDQRAAMVIGSYRMVDFSLNTLLPGIIDHREWTPDNGRNNALRINGLGAPRAFDTTVLRRLGFPNTSYGEDYALGLAISRRYRIARIYDELYLCRRWEGNSDASLNVERLNINNSYKDELRSIEICARRCLNEQWLRPIDEEAVNSLLERQPEVWEEFRLRLESLHDNIVLKELSANDYSLSIQHNPDRVKSTCAKVDPKYLKNRPCFLCDNHRPAQQLSLTVERYYRILVNPYPILPQHLTIISRRHTPQLLDGRLADFCRLVSALPDYVVFYNGARCGASAPDHFHFQAGARNIVPLQRDWEQYSGRLERVFPLSAEEQAEMEDSGYEDKRSGIYLVKGYACPVFAILGERADGDQLLLNKLLQALPLPTGRKEPDVNLLAWMESGHAVHPDLLVTLVFPRSKHRPQCYSAEGKIQFLVSPGALDMAGLIITPRIEDFERMTVRQATAILTEVSLSESEVAQAVRRMHKGERRSVHDKEERLFSDRKEPYVTVGIMQDRVISFVLNTEFTAKGIPVIGNQTVEYRDGGIVWNGNVYSELSFHPMDDDCTSSFTLHNVPIGIHFHWEQCREQTFRGSLSFIIDEEKLIAINRLPVELYLQSVIASEMSATASMELLKAHAVVSRSWLFKMMEQRRLNAVNTNDSFFSIQRKDDEYIRWYGRDDHTLFDVCADDHCQRYQGISIITRQEVKQAVEETRGQVLTCEGEICDARFSKCCGGITERYAACWEDSDKPYLTSVRDLSEEGRAVEPPIDLTQEAAMETWVHTKPDAFCRTEDPDVISQFFKDYDRETTDFYRWENCLSQNEIRELVEKKTGLKFGDILDLIPVERSTSGRLVRLKIVGTERSITVGKELEIRRILSPSHLYSSAFVVEKSGQTIAGAPAYFKLFGAGWGHGVGLCQVGAAVMSRNGYGYRDILFHYYKNATIERKYE